MRTAEGKYWGPVTKLAFGQSKNGSPQVEVSIQLTHNEQLEKLAQPIERTSFWSLVGAAEDYSMKKLDAIEFNGDFHNSPDYGQQAKEGVWWVCEHDEYNGKTRERWDLLEWGTGRETKPMETDTLRTLTARWKARNSGKPKPAPAAAGPTPPADPPY